MITYWKGNLTEHFTLKEYAGSCKIAYLDMASYLQATMMEEFRVWLKRPVYVTSWFRDEDGNKKVGGSKESNHLRGCATDWHTDIAIGDVKFVKYSKKWKAICKSHGVVGESGLYKWGCHFGYQNEAQVKRNNGQFINWDSRSGKQINNAFRI